MGKRRRNSTNPSEQLFEKTNPEVEKPDEWTLVSSLSYLLKISEDSGLTKSFWADAREALDYANGIMGMNDEQTLAVALLANEGDAMSWNGMGEFFGCTRLQMMTWSEALEELVEKGWIMHHAKRDFAHRWMGYRLEHGVVTAIRHNKCFEPEKLDGLTLQDFIDRLASHIYMNMENPNITLDDDIDWMLRLVAKNNSLQFCRLIDSIENRYDKALLLLVVADYALWADTSREGLQFEAITNMFPEEHKCGNIRRNLRHGTHSLLQLKYIDFGCDEGIADSERFTLGESVKDNYLSEYKLSHTNCSAPKTSDRLLRSHKLIKEKQLFYNPTESEQVERLRSLLSHDKFRGVQQRLEEKGMRKGVACIFYGDPGTGKTETVLQIARLTGRDIMQVEVAGMRDKWVGQSEKNIKSVFRRYRMLCNNCDTEPILFFNEADAIFGRRFESPERSVEKMDNSMQNIILQELEDLEGILIATTNLTSSLDPAFERRFLFKVEFNRPEQEARNLIWKSMMGEAISDEDAACLSHKYDFTGGQIENISRKHTVDYVLEGKEPDIERLLSYCEEEMVKLRGTRRTLGFKL